MHRSLLGLASFTILALCLVPAHADTFSFSFSGDDSGAGFFYTTSDQGGGQYQITGISGTFNKFDITGLLAPLTYPTGFPTDTPNDNLLFVPRQDGGYLDFNGVSFTISNRGRDINLYYDSGLGYFAIKGAREKLDTLTDFHVKRVATTPEPSSLALLGTGVLGALGATRRRFFR